MVSVHPSTVPDAVDVVITFRHDANPIYVSVDAVNQWEPQLMNSNGEAYEHVITLPRSTRTILYKFRIGDHHWIHDMGVHAEPDNFGGWNNKFDIPELPTYSNYAESATDGFSEDGLELESVMGVESVADTVSEFGEPHDVDEQVEFVDVDDSDPDFPPSHHSDEAVGSEKTKKQKKKNVAFSDEPEKRQINKEGPTRTGNVLYRYALFGLVVATAAWLWVKK